MSDAPNTDPRTALATERTKLADYRTALALDRTTLAWVRTTLTIGDFGFGTIGFFRALDQRLQIPEAARLHHDPLWEWLVSGAILATIVAGASHWNSLRRMEPGELAKAARWPLSFTMRSVCGSSRLSWTLVTGH